MLRFSGGHISAPQTILPKRVGIEKVVRGKGMTEVFDSIGDLDAFLGKRRSAVTIGNFDGCHVGHQALFEELKSFKSAKDLASVVITFDPHPAKVLGFSKKLFRVQSLSDRLVALASYGLDAIVKVNFTTEIANLEPTDFVLKFLVNGAHARCLAIGEDFRFGKGRQGSIDTLRDMGNTYGYSVSTLPTKLQNQEIVSSTLMRKYISEDGDMEKASSLTGRQWSFVGKVIHGSKLGRTIGFPTANLDLGDVIVPKSGVYAGWAMIESTPKRELIYPVSDHQDRMPMVMNVGFRPTVDGQMLDAKVEVHLLGTSPLAVKPVSPTLNLYDQNLRVEPLVRLRDEKKFESLAELKEQIAGDCKIALSFLKLRLFKSRL